MRQILKIGFRVYGLAFSKIVHTCYSLHDINFYRLEKEIKVATKRKLTNKTQKGLSYQIIIKF